MANQYLQLTEVQLRAARLYAMGYSQQDIANEIGVDRTTLYRWRKQSAFADAIADLLQTVSREERNRVVKDISEINDIILSTLVDVAENDSSGAARVSAARVLVDMVERAEERSFQANHDIMRDQSAEIRQLLEDIREGQ